MVPYTRLHEKTAASCPPGTEFVYVPGDSDYCNVIERYWRAGEGFVIVEHDIELHSRVIPSLRHCSRAWCQYPYLLRGNYQVAFGCVRFSTRLLREYPDLIDDMLALPNPFYQTFQRRNNPFDMTRETDPDGQKIWTQLDTRIGRLLIEHGYEGHRHEPPVMHNSDVNNPDRIYPPNWVKEKRPPFEGLSLTEVVPNP